MSSTLSSIWPQVQSLKMDQSPLNTDSHKNLERQTAGLRNEVQVGRSLSTSSRG